MPKPLVVSKANSLIEATYYLSLAEQRLLLFVIARLDSREDLTAGISHTITASDLAAAFGMPRKQAYELLRDAAERLYERSVIVHRPDAVDPSKDFTLTRWVSTVDFDGSHGQVSLFFAPGILPFISHLRREFAQYQLVHVAQMTSIYAIRLYELLIQWRSTGSRDVSLTWLRERFDLQEKYSNIRDLKRFVINPAVEQINEHSDLWVTWEQRKRGRVIEALIFKFGQKADKTEPAPVQSKKPKLTREYVQKHAQPGESWEEAWARLSRFK